MMEKNYHVDYSHFYLEADKNLNAILEDMNKRNYEDAEHHAVTAIVEMKLMLKSIQILREKEQR